MTSPHREPLEPLGLEPGAAAALAQYLDLLALWSRRANLTGAEDPAARVAVLVAPTLALAPRLAPGALIDVGSGNGSPGLVLAVLRRDLGVTLLEPRQKRWAFLREAARAVERRDVAVLRARHDGYRGAPAESVTLRALRLSLPALAPLVAPAGRVYVLGEPPAPATGFEPEPGGAGLSVFRRLG